MTGLFRSRIFLEAICKVLDCRPGDVLEMCPVLTA
ncbi:MAG: helix-turn-helix domain-containing protein [Lewinellaceae bacterium]|nr:helix-turn-helix domain-containing protein [Lewinellaceae bacterium]